MELIELQIETEAGLLDVAAEIEILDDGTLIVDSIMVYPSSGARRAAGLRQMWSVRARLLDAAQAMGARRMKARYVRTTGVNPGRTMEIEVDLNDDYNNDTDAGRAGTEPP